MTNPCNECIVTSMCLKSCRGYFDYVTFMVPNYVHAIFISKEIRRRIDKQIIKCWDRPYNMKNPSLTVIRYNTMGTITKVNKIRVKRRHREEKPM